MNLEEKRMRDFHLRLCDSIHQQLKEQAKAQGRSMASLCREALELYLTRLELDPAPTPLTQYCFNPTQAALENQWGEVGLSQESLQAWNDGFCDLAWNAGYHQDKLFTHAEPCFDFEPRARSRGGRHYRGDAAPAPYTKSTCSDRWLDELWA